MITPCVRSGKACIKAFIVGTHRFRKDNLAHRSGVYKETGAP